MSAITKPCQWNGCDGTGWYNIALLGDAVYPFLIKCSECKGTGRVPDVEATLRAELEAARAEVARLTKELADTKRYEQAEYEGRAAAIADIDVVRLALASVFGRGHEERDVVELAADVVRVVAELKGHVAELDGRWKDNVNLTAEVERLTGREREAARVMRAHLDGDATNRMCAAWLAGHDGEVPA